MLLVGNKFKGFFMRLYAQIRFKYHFSYAVKKSGLNLKIDVFNFQGIYWKLNMWIMSKCFCNLHIVEMTWHI